jgi:hypothetical protein
MAWSIFTDGGGDAVAVGWAKQLLQSIGAPVSAGNVQFIYDWEKSEGGGGKYNPLNQGPVPNHPELTTTGSQYGGGAADYASWQAGLQGASDYLNMPNYTKVLAALKSGDSAGARNALWASPWAESHYGYGTNWFGGPIPGGTNALPAGFSFGTGTTGATGGTQDASNSTDPLFCLWRISFPISGTTCVLSKTEARAILGGMLLIAGGIISLAGTAVLVAYGLKKTGVANAVGGAMSVVPGVGSVAGKAVKSSAQKGASSKSSNPNNLKPVNERPVKIRPAAERKKLAEQGTGTHRKEGK